jgi:hypothetical protein
MRVALAIVAATVLFAVLLIIWIVHVETEATTYVASHDCSMVERTEGHWQSGVILVGKVVVPNNTWIPPRGRFVCTTGEERWITVE